ncbi:MAG: hypothetical protein WCS87_15665 [Methylococcaceae bacterium]
MQALEIEVDIMPDGQLLNARLPTSCQSMFGRHTKLIMILPEPQFDVVQRQQRTEKWHALLKETQSLPQAKNMTEAEIAAEIEAHQKQKADAD